MKSLYRAVCERALVEAGYPDVPWQVLEAYLRDIFGTLDAVPYRTFVEQGMHAARYWREFPGASREFVRGFGLPEID